MLYRVSVAPNLIISLLVRLLCVLMHYEEFLDAFRELYGQRPLTEGEFVGIVRQLQERQPLINYMDTTVYEDIYR